MARRTSCCQRTIAAATTLLLLCASGFAAAPSGSGGDRDAIVSKAYNVTAFDGIASCLPFNILVTSGPQPGVAIAAQRKVVDVVNATVLNRTLYLSTSDAFSTDRSVRMNITMPANGLTEVLNTGIGSIILGSGFASKQLKIEADSAGKVLARNLKASQLLVKATGLGEVFASGTFNMATIATDGAARVTVEGLQTNATVNAKDASTISLAPTSDSASISGRASGLGKVRYTQGDCNVKSKSAIDVPFFKSSFSFGACWPMDENDLPNYRPKWSCGMKVLSAACCSPDDDGNKKCSQGHGIHIDIGGDQHDDQTASNNSNDGLDITVDSEDGSSDINDTSDQSQSQGPVWVLATECKDAR